MKRQEFSAAVKRAAIRRSEGRCEAVGAVYGLPRLERCTASLANGVEFDHYPVRAADGGDNSLSNCMAVCRTCHRYKTRTFDIPMMAKSRRVRTKRSVFQAPETGFPTNRLGPYRRKLNGRIEPR